MNADMPLADALQRIEATAWEDGFHAGQLYGAAMERHDPQWDMEGPPERPINPYTMKEVRNV